MSIDAKIRESLENLFFRLSFSESDGNLTRSSALVLDVIDRGSGRDDMLSSNNLLHSFVISCLW